MTSRTTPVGPQGRGAVAPGALLIAALAAGCVPATCPGGITEGDVVEITLVDRYEPGGAFTYVGRPSTLPSCEGRDTLGLGTLTAQIIRDVVPGAGFCHARAAELLSPDLGLEDPWPNVLPGSFFEVRHGYVEDVCPSAWVITVLRPNQLDNTPLDERAAPGTFPPLIARRSISPTCSEIPPCQDEFVAEARLVGRAVPPDGGTDG